MLLLTYLALLPLFTSTVALLPYSNVYCGPIALLPRLLWPYSFTFTSTVVQLLYFHVYCDPITLLLPLLWLCCLVYFQKPFPIKNSYFTLYPRYIRRYYLCRLETYLIGFLDPKRVYFDGIFCIRIIISDLAYFLNPFSMKNSYFTPNCHGK